MTGKKRRYSLLMTLPYGWKLHERKNSVGSAFRTRHLAGGCRYALCFSTAPKGLLVDERHKNTFTSVFLDSKGGVINAVKMRPFSKEIHCTTAKAGYALEVNDGLFNEISDDMTVRGLPE